MKQTAKEKLVARFTRLGKKNKWAKRILLPFLLIALVGISIPEYFISNGKKYACVIAACLFFVMSNSFSFPIFEDMELTGQSMMMGFVIDDKPVLNTYGLDTGMTPDTSVISDEVELLEDEDVLDGYSNCELENMEEIDKYTLDEILEEKDTASADGAKTDGSVQTGQEAFKNVSFDKFDKNDWRLLLINKQHPVPEDYTFELGTIKGAMKCDVRIIDDLLEMMQAAKNDGINLVICSPYRDMSRQEMLFGRKIKAYMGKGMSYMDAYKVSSQAVTVPGASEHQIGLALDIVCDSYYDLNEGFGETAAGKWLAEHSCEYGFTLRYPSGKEYITSIEYEPWHFRYVGREAATVMKEKGICLEEFVDSL